MPSVHSIVESIIRPLRTRVYSMISRAIIESARDGDGMQLIKLTGFADENRTDVEHFENYGFASVPPAKSEAVIVCPTGAREHMIAIVVGNRKFRLKGLENGDVAMYTENGDYIKIKAADGLIEVVTKGDLLATIGGKVTVDAAADILVKTQTECVVDSPSIKLGKTAAEAIIKGNTFQALFNAHTHISSTPGNVTAPPTTPLTGTELSLVSKTE